MTARKPLPSALGDGPFTVAEAYELGVSRDRLAATDLIKPFAGIRMPARSLLRDPQTAEDWMAVFARHREENLAICAAYALRMPRGAFYCGPTAALLHGIPLPYRLSADRRLHVGLPDDCRAVQVVGAIGHSYSIAAADVTIADVPIGGARLTSPERTWCDLGRVLRLTDLVAAGDHLIRRDNPLTSMSRLSNAVAHQNGQRGVKGLREALTLLNARAESPKESILRVELVRGGLPEPEVNADVFDTAGRFIARADLLYREYRLILEYEGLQHLLDPDQWQHDIERTRRLEDEGWRVIRVTHADLTDPRRLILRLKAHIRHASC